MRYKSSFPVLVLFTIISAISLAAQTPAPKLTAAAWQADVRSLGTELPLRHKDAFYRLKREDFERAVNDLYARVPQMSDDEIIVGLMKLVAMVHDGHTTLIPRPFFQSGIYPIKLYRFSDGLYVQKAAPAYAQLVGSRVISMGGVSADEAMKRVGPVVAADNEMGILDLGPSFFSVPEIDSGLGMVADKHTLILRVTRAGTEQTVEVHPEGNFNDLFKSPAGWVDAADKTPAPLYLQHPGDIYWLEYLKETHTLYVKQNAVGNKPDETLAAFYKRVFDLIDANPVDKLVIDLRNNGGGNNGLNSPIILDLVRSKVDKRGHLFVITGRQTFSAAQNFVNQMEKWAEPIFVGEPTADHPNMFGDNRPFVLPNSGLTVRASTLWWQDLDPRDSRPWTAPDISADLSFEDYRSGRDPAFQAILDYRSGSTMGEMISAAANGDSLGDLVQRLRVSRNDPKTKYVNTEDAINRLGYTLLAKKRPADAVEVLKLNTEFYPTSANVYDSLGDALAAAGRTDDAVKSYEKALSIDPNLTTSIESLKRSKKN